MSAVIGDGCSAAEISVLVRDRLGRCAVEPPSTIPTADGDDVEIALPATMAEAPGFAVRTAGAQPA